MELNTIVYFFLIVLTLQVGVLTQESGTKNQATVTDADVSFTQLKNLYNRARTALDKLSSCGAGTHLEIVGLASERLGNYQGCVNATREIAEYEEFFIDLYYFVKFVGSTFVDIVKSVIDCRHEKGFFNILNCTVSEIQQSGSQIDEILSSAEHLIDEVHIDTDNLIYYIKECFGRNTTEFLSEAVSMIEKC